MGRLTESIVMKIVVLIAIMIFFVVSFVVVDMKFSKNVVNNITELQSRDMLIDSYAHQAYDSYLILQSQTNVWMELYGYSDQSLVNLTLQQVTQAENQLNNSLHNLGLLLNNPQDQTLLHATESGVKSYEGYFSQAEKSSFSTHHQTQIVTYVQNDDVVSAALTSDMQKMQNIVMHMIQEHSARSVQASQQQFNVTLIFGGIVIFLEIGLLATIYFLLKPIPVIALRIHKIAEGNLTVEEIQVNRNDEVGSLADSFNQMVRSLREIIQEIGSTVNLVTNLSEELTANAEQTKQTTEGISVAIQEMASGTDTQAHSTYDMVKIMETLVAKSVQVASSVQNVSFLAVSASDKSVEGQLVIQTVTQQMQSIQQAVQELADAVKNLGVRSQQIGQIAQMITDIAAQTHLLSLNAAIEAARAGEQGRGFAVVADEVGKLAKQSAQSAKAITGFVSEIESKTEEAMRIKNIATTEVNSGIEKVNLAGNSFRVIERSVQDVASHIQEVSSSTQEISTATGHAMHSVHVVSEVATSIASSTQEVAASIEEQFASMEEITASAITLLQMAGQVQELIGRFEL